MLNLNYNVIYCRLNKPTGRPFVPSPRFDPYSGSIVLAVPGTVFTNGYVPVFNQVNPWDDISPYIRGIESYDADTGKYVTPFSGSAHTMLATGSRGVITGSLAESNFSEFGYNTSIYSSGYKCVQVSVDTGSRQGINLDYTKDYVIETWVAYESTASIVITGSAYWGLPNKAMAIKEGQSPSGQQIPNATSSYWFMPGWGGQPESGISNFYSGSSAHGVFPFSFASAPGNNWAWGTSSYQWNPLEWHHYAVSYQTSGSSANGTHRLYRDGVLIGQRVINGQAPFPGAFLPTSSLGTNLSPLYLFGSPFEIFPYDKVTSGLNIYDTGSAWYVQDFRMYNGTNKNYTGSIIPIPESMIIGIKEPYPVNN